MIDSSKNKLINLFIILNINQINFILLHCISNLSLIFESVLSDNCIGSFRFIKNFFNFDTTVFLSTSLI